MAVVWMSGQWVLEWACPDCKDIQRHSSNPHTPVRKSATLYCTHCIQHGNGSVEMNPSQTSEVDPRS